MKYQAIGWILGILAAIVASLSVSILMELRGNQVFICGFVFGAVFGFIGGLWGMRYDVDKPGD